MLDWTFVLILLYRYHTCVGGGGKRMKADWYEKNNVQVRLNCPVLSIDMDKKTVMTKQGEYSYDKLVMATGVKSRKGTLAG